MSCLLCFCFFQDECDNLSEDECLAPDCIYDADSCRTPMCGDTPFKQYCIYCTLESQCNNHDDHCTWDNGECIFDDSLTTTTYLPYKKTV